MKTQRWLLLVAFTLSLFLVACDQKQEVILSSKEKEIEYRDPCSEYVANLGVFTSAYDWRFEAIVINGVQHSIGVQTVDDNFLSLSELDKVACKIRHAVDQNVGPNVTKIDFDQVSINPCGNTWDVRLCIGLFCDPPLSIQSIILSKRLCNSSPPFAFFTIPFGTSRECLPGNYPTECSALNG